MTWATATPSGPSFAAAEWTEKYNGESSPSVNPLVRPRSRFRAMSRQRIGQPAASARRSERMVLIEVQQPDRLGRGDGENRRPGPDAGPLGQLDLRALGGPSGHAWPPRSSGPRRPVRPLAAEDLRRGTSSLRRHTRRPLLPHLELLQRRSGRLVLRVVREGREPHQRMEQVGEPPHPDKLPDPVADRRRIERSRIGGRLLVPEPAGRDVSSRKFRSRDTSTCHRVCGKR